MGKRPAFQFYPGDWLRDGVAGCSLAAQGLWLRMMVIAHDSERYGYIQQNGKPIPPSSLARRVGADSTEQYLTLLQELDDALVPSRTPDGIIFSRRMVRDEQLRQATNLRVKKHRSNGQCNGDVTHDVTRKYEDEDEIEKTLILEVQSQNQNPQQKRKDKTGTRIPEGFKVSDAMRVFARDNNLPDPDLHIAEFIDYWAAQPGSRGVKVDWDATLRNWLRRAKQFHSGGTNGKLSYEQRAEKEREIARRYAARAGSGAAD